MFLVRAGRARPVFKPCALVLDDRCSRHLPYGSIGRSLQAREVITHGILEYARLSPLIQAAEMRRRWQPDLPAHTMRDIRLQATLHDIISYFCSTSFDVSLNKLLMQEREPVWSGLIRNQKQRPPVCFEFHVTHVQSRVISLSGGHPHAEFSRI
jgi:hypothetical protein